MATESPHPGLQHDLEMASCGGDAFECWMTSCPESIRHDAGAPEHRGEYATNPATTLCNRCGKSIAWGGKCGPENIVGAWCGAGGWDGGG